MPPHYVLVDVAAAVRAPRIISAVSAMPGHEFTIGDRRSPAVYVCYATKAAACSGRSGSMPRCAPAGPARRRVSKDVVGAPSDPTAAFVPAALQVPALLQSKAPPRKHWWGPSRAI